MRSIILRMIDDYFTFINVFTHLSRVNFLNIVYLQRALDKSLGDAREKQEVQGEIPEMPLGFEVLPPDLKMITEHGEHQVRQPKRDDHPVDGIDPVKPNKKKF